MKDIQSLHDSRRIDIRRVGVKAITYPIIVLDKENSTQQTLARMNMYVNLPHRFKGTHMSRFVEILHRFHGRFNLKTFRRILEEMKARLEAEAAHLEMEFPYFLTSGHPGRPAWLARHECRLHGTLAQTFDMQVEVDVPVPLPSPSPHSAAISTGLWGGVTVSVRMKRFLWIEDLIALVAQGIGPHPDRPETVESLCHRVSDILQATGSFHWYKVVVKNIVSGYSAFAATEWPAPVSEWAGGLSADRLSGRTAETEGYLPL